jgi:UDP-N-acetylglucosamine--N-acetylmuramyl-(pentapeptide) pyrophosphoryl-undecaprenol N-acetylglucosamine transferase
MMRGVSYPAIAADAPFNILVLGGSQGARILSAVVPRAIAALDPAIRQRIEIAQQARPEDIEAARRIYRDHAIAAETSTFFDDVPARLAGAHLVISRAGASTVAELGAVGRPAILVPFAAAAEDHQTLNARAFAANGAAWVMTEQEFTPDALAARLASLMGDAARLAQAAASANSQGRPQAAHDLADLVDRLAGGANGNGSHAPLERRAA